MADKQTLLKYLEVISQRVRHHHDAIWEEEKHYSWWIYIVFAALIYLYASDIHAPYKLTLIVLASLFGIYLCVAAFRIVYKEGEYFAEAHQLYQRTIISLGLDKPQSNLPNNKPLDPTAKYQELDDVKSQANKGNFGIRHFFRLTFIVEIILFVGFIVFSVLTVYST